MSIRTRPYTDADMGAIQTALAGWIQAAGPCGYYHPGNLPHWIYATLRGHRPISELVQIWEDNTGIVGLSICGLFHATFQVFIHPAQRGTFIEQNILQDAFMVTRRYLNEANQPDMPVVTDVFSCDTTRIEQVTQLGFAQYRLWDHINECSLADLATLRQLPNGFSLRAACMDDAEQLGQARNETFGEHWTGEHYRDEVMRKPGYHPEHELLVIAPDGQVAAFTTIWLDEHNRVGMFEPVGTRPAFRRRGLAQALMLHALHIMKHAGMHTASVEHDATNSAAAALYQSLSFRKRYETLGFMKL